MRQINVKNKILFIIFTFIILIIISILVYSISFAKNKNSFSFDVTPDMLLFANDYSSVDTSSSGKIEKKWNDNYYYLSSDGKSYYLGNDLVIYNKSMKSISVIGEKYRVMEDGTVSKSTDVTEITDTKMPSFYKLEDRKYLIVYDDIYNSDKTIYLSKYVEVIIDTQGNASLLNDAINLKTINPMVLEFGEMKFDVANEKLLVNELEIDLKQIIGSTNKYTPSKRESVVKYDAKELIDSYNDLVNNFVQYATNHNYSVSANNPVSYNNVVVNNNNNNSGSASSASNKTEILKRVSLRGTISYPSFIDVSYVVTDPENKYQAVYLLVTGFINNQMQTQKIVLDKYDTKYRITELSPNNEYTISLGYIEVVLSSGDKSLVDNVEDVINIRTSKINYNLTIDKIANGKVYYTFKMPSNFALESGNISFYIDGELNTTTAFNYRDIISDEGFSSSFPLDTGSIYEIRVESGTYASKPINIDIGRKFVISSS